MGGLAIQGAADALIERARGLAARLMQADGAELTFEGAAFTISGTDRGVTLAEIARAADETGETQLPAGTTGPIEASHDAEVAPMTFANGCHICELLIDPETGQVEVRSYLIVDDYGRVINPQLCAGQVHGAVAQGIGQALLFSPHLIIVISKTRMTNAGWGKAYGRRLIFLKPAPTKTCATTASTRRMTFWPTTTL